VTAVLQGILLHVQAGGTDPVASERLARGRDAEEEADEAPRRPRPLRQREPAPPLLHRRSIQVAILAVVVALLAIPGLWFFSSDAEDPGRLEPIARQPEPRPVSPPPPAEIAPDDPRELDSAEVEADPEPVKSPTAPPPTSPTPAAIERQPPPEPEPEPEPEPDPEPIASPPVVVEQEASEPPPLEPAPPPVELPSAVEEPPPAPIKQPEPAAPPAPPRSQAQLWIEARTLREAKAYTSLIPVLDEIMAAHPADLEAAEWRRKSERWVAKQSAEMREVLEEMLEDFSAYIDDREIQNIEEQFVGWLDASTRAYFDGLFRNNDGKIRSFPGAFQLDIVDGEADFTAEMRITAKPTRGAPFETIGTYLWSARLVRRDGDYLFEGSFP
jgi:hypothetical protein